MSNTQIPKGLTPELLGLVLGEEVEEIINIEDNHINIWYEKDRHGAEINLDTLTRICKEWCAKNQYTLTTTVGIERTIIEVYSIDKYKVVYHEWKNTELEAVLKATAWVAKELNLLGANNE